jgi:hypothetical protein
MSAACAPAAGRPAVSYQTQPQQIIGFIGQLCPLLVASGYNYFSVETIGETFITCTSNSTTGLSILGALGGTSTPSYRLAVTLQPLGAITQVAISGTPNGNGDVNKLLDEIDRQLTSAFTRVQ